MAIIISFGMLPLIQPYCLMVKLKYYIFLNRYFHLGLRGFTDL